MKNMNNKTKVKDFIINDEKIICFKEIDSKQHLDFNSEWLDTFFLVERNHFWFIARRERIIQTFKKYLKKSSNILEIGAGTGYIAQGIQGDGYNVSVGDIHLSGLIYAKKNGIEKCYLFDIFDPPFRNKFDAIGMFDVLEHLEDHSFALSQVSKMLKPRGKIFVTVPAHKWLWNHHDVMSNHKRRYSRKELELVLEKAGFQIIESRFFFIAILPLLFFRRILYIAKGNKMIQNPEENMRINPVINSILLKLTRLENYLSKWLPNISGGSLLCVAVKK